MSTLLPGYITTAQYAKALGISVRRVAALCLQGRIPGAVRLAVGNGVYLIPEGVRHERKGSRGRGIEQGVKANG